MRAIPLASFALFAVAANAQDWENYESARFGFALDIPPGFSTSFISENGNGRVYHGAEGDHLLAVWGAELPNGFRREVETRMVQDERDGWDISYERVTPNWASYSGTLRGNIRYVRAVRLCDNRAAFFYLEYPREDKEALDPVVVRLVRSLRGSAACG